MKEAANIPALGTITGIPHRLIWDLELRDEIPTKSGGGLDWDYARSGKCGISVLSAWDTHSPFPIFALLDGNRLPRIILTEQWLIEMFAEVDGHVTWNGAGFDLPVVGGAVPKLYDVMASKKHVDLMAVCALLKVGVEPSAIRNGVHDDWYKLVPRIGAKAKSFINDGWGLEECASATLGDRVRKFKGMDGGKPMKYWNQGRYSQVGSYCVGDSALLHLLYAFAWTNGHIVSHTHGKVEIPRDVL